MTAATHSAVAPPMPLTANPEASNPTQDSSPPAGCPTAPDTKTATIRNETASTATSTRVDSTIARTPSTPTTARAAPAHTHQAPPSWPASVAPNNPYRLVWML